jgi:hypothetical protein
MVYYYHPVEGIDFSSPHFDEVPRALLVTLEINQKFVGDLRDNCYLLGVPISSMEGGIYVGESSIVL